MRCFSKVRRLVVCVLFIFIVRSAYAEIYGGVEFPQGEISFADAVVSYQPDAGGAIPDSANSDPSNALGPPEVPGSTSVGACTDTPSDCPFVSLGDGGNIILEFTDNLLSGSNNDDFDIWVFEVGPDIEDTYVEISKDNVTWYSVGKITGSTSGIDIDAFGFSSVDNFRFIKLIDDPSEGGQTGASVGADIDAVGAISTVEVTTEVVPIKFFALVLTFFALFFLGVKKV